MRRHIFSFAAQVLQETKPGTSSMRFLAEFLKPKVGSPQAVQKFSRRISTAVIPKRPMFPYNFYNVHPSMLAQVRRYQYTAPVGEDMRRAVATGAAAVRSTAFELIVVRNGAIVGTPRGLSGVIPASVLGDGAQ